MPTRSSVVHMKSSGLPLIEPDQVCEVCGTQGTVGRAMRTDANGDPTEIHRFCAPCWPEHAARYRARWDEERRLARDARIRARGGEHPQHFGTSFASATWHGILDRVKQIDRAVHEGNSPAGLGRLAAEIAEGAADRVGDMPFEVECFLREHENDPLDDLPPTREEVYAMARANGGDLIRDALIYSNAALAAIDAALNADVVMADLDLPAQLAKGANSDALRIAIERELDAMHRRTGPLKVEALNERRQCGEWERRAALAVAEGRDDLARNAHQRAAQHRSNADPIERELGECEALERQLREAMTRLSSTAGGG